MTDRDRHEDARQPDPTADAWSAWLPRLDPPSTPLPQASGPPGTSASAVPPPPSSTTIPPDAVVDRERLPPPLPQLPPPPPSAPRGWYAAPPPPQPQPPGATPPPYGSPPPSRVGLAVVCTILCFMPFGIVALVKASSVRTKWARGRWDEARRTSASVKTWCLLAFLVSPGLGLLYACTAVLGMH